MDRGTHGTGVQHREDSYKLVLVLGTSMQHRGQWQEALFRSRRTGALCCALEHKDNRCCPWACCIVRKCGISWVARVLLQHQGQQTPGPGESLKVLGLHSWMVAGDPDHPVWPSQEAEIQKEIRPPVCVS